MDYLEKGSDDNLAAKIRAACQAFEAEDFSADGSGSTPRLNIRTLARHASDPDDSSGGRLARAKKERAEVWQKAVAIRKQHWRIEMWSGWTAKDIKADLVKFRSQSKVQTELNEKHKAFFLYSSLVCGQFREKAHGPHLHDRQGLGRARLRVQLHLRI